MCGDADYWKMRELLVASAAGTPVGLNWDVRRLDGKRFYNADPTANPLLARPVSLWEDAGELVGFILPESPCDAHLQVHPDYRHLEEEMIAWAETHLAGPATDAGAAANSRSTSTSSTCSANGCCRRAGSSRRRCGGCSATCAWAASPSPRRRSRPAIPCAPPVPLRQAQGRRGRQPAHRRPAQRRVWPHLPQRGRVSQLHLTRALLPPRTRPGDRSAGWDVRRLRRHPLRPGQPLRHLRAGLHAPRPPPPGAGRRVDAGGAAAAAGHRRGGSHGRHRRPDSRQPVLRQPGLHRGVPRVHVAESVLRTGRGRMLINTMTVLFVTLGRDLTTTTIS